MAKKETIRVPLTFEDIPLSSIGKWDEVDYSDIHLVHLFSNMDKSTLRTLPVKAIEQTAQHLRKILSTPTEEHVQTITIDGVKYGFIKDWKELTAGEYVDIAQYLEEPLRNATKLMSIFYRPIVEEWENGHSIQAYEGTKGHEVFNDVSASYFYGAIGFFVYNDGLRYNFSAVFGEPSNRNREAEKEVVRKTTFDSFSERWAWYDFLMGFVNADVTRLNEVTKLPITQLLTHRAYVIDKQNIEKNTI